jgi:uncharacterized protein
MKRRTFIEFIGKGALVVPAVPSVLWACNPRKPTAQEVVSELEITSTGNVLFPSTKDELVLAEGLEFDILIKQGDSIIGSVTFGMDNDYIAYLPMGKNEGILWVNHEDIKRVFIPGHDPDKALHRNQVLMEMNEVGGSIMRIEKKGGKWQVVKDDKRNRRITAATKIPFEWHEKIMGANEAVGTLANCAGGVTPWGTVLTCEENYHDFYGEYDYIEETYIPSKMQWESFFPNNRPQHYGWVVEVDVYTGRCKKHIGLGRFAHECATVKELPDKRVVIYSGDDKKNGCLYKFISDKPGTIYPGKLYVANLEKSRWEWIDISRPGIRGRFANQTEVLIRTREAALIVGGTEMDRPEDIEIDPLTGDVLVTLTNNKPKGNYHGSIFKLTEQGDYDSMEFTYDTFLTGGEETGFSCPDNMAFDAAGNLWFCSDIAGDAMNRDPYTRFGNNGLFVLIRNGQDAGKLFQVASAPNDAEFTGPCFAPDGDTLFLSVQHPGEESKSLSQLTSHWPGGGSTVPRSAVVAISGDLIRALQTVV